ncbi:MAG TPA: hypothetical protein VGC41_21085 [Kofleriaceae bacterium]
MYRDPVFTCPACTRPLRSFNERLVCDACDGIMVSLADLAHAVHDMTSVEPTFAWLKEHPGKRACPRCAATMTECKLEIHLGDDHEKTKPLLDRCSEHGLWFDAEELAAVIEKIASKGFGGGVGRKVVARTTEPRGDGRWSAVFPNRSGGWGGF